MLLADLGGNRLKLARFEAGACHGWRDREWPEMPSAEDLAWLRATGGASGEEVLLSSTRPAALPALRKALGDALHLIEPADVPLDRTTTGTGSDRLLAGLAAQRMAGGACLVADLGTAWTLDAIDAKPCFRGGVIGPGLGVQTAALASACPHLDPPGESTGALPTSTAAAVRAGTLEALAAAIDGLAARMEAEIGGVEARFLTGGDAAQLGPLLVQEWRPIDHLVLHGLAEVVRRR